MTTNLPSQISNAYKKILDLSGSGASNLSGVVGAIKAAASQTGVDFAYLLNKAGQESGFNPTAKASSSSATGLYQFVKQTWLQMVKQHGDKYGLSEEAQAIDVKNGQASVKDKALREKILNMRNDPVLSAAMAAEFTRENKDYLEAKVGGTVGSTELYLAHFLGAGGAAKFISTMRGAPDAAAADILPEAAEANPAVFYDKSGEARSLREVYDRFAANFTGKNANRFAGLDAAVSEDTAKVGESCAQPSLAGRDFTQYSADFYAEPNAAESASWRQNGTTADTLFNVMVMAQSSMNDSLYNFTRTGGKDTGRTDARS